MRNLAVGSMTSGRSRIVGRRRGIAASEFALILPFLLTVCLATIDVGRGLHERKVAWSAARVGAEYAATHRFTPYTRVAWEARVRQAVNEEFAEITNITAGSFSLGPTVTITVVDNADNLPRVGVKVVHTFEPIIDWPGLGDSFIIQREVWVRAYR